MSFKLMVIVFAVISVVNISSDDPEDPVVIPRNDGVLTGLITNGMSQINNQLKKNYRLQSLAEDPYVISIGESKFYIAVVQMVSSPDPPLVCNYRIIYNRKAAAGNLTIETANTNINCDDWKSFQFYTERQRKT